MGYNNLDDAINHAKSIQRYLLTLTTFDDKKSEGQLTHFIDRKDFPLEDIVPSLDASVRILGINPPQTIDIVKPPKPIKPRLPLKIAILTHFNRCPDSYSPGKAVRHQIKLLRHFGHEVVFFLQEGSQLQVECEKRDVMPRFKREKNVINHEMKKKTIEMLKKELTPDFDVAITHDLYLDDCITYREAIKECGVDIPWIHWARSGVGHAINFKMDNARYVYMNYADAGNFAKMIGVDSSKVRVIFNEKDPGLMYNWDPITSMVVDKMRLWEKDIVQIYPICTTRMAAKGLHSVIKVFGSLKRLGKKVGLVVCNSNGRRRQEDIKAQTKFAEEWGLGPMEFMFTSTLASDLYPIHSEVPHKVVLELMQMGNLFVFPTMAEVCSNVLLEAGMTKNLVIINDDLKSLYDFVDKDVAISYPFTSLQHIHFEARDHNSLSKLAEVVIKELDSNRMDRQFRHTWKTHNMYTVYYDQLEPVLREVSRKK